MNRCKCAELAPRPGVPSSQAPPPSAEVVLEMGEARKSTCSTGGSSMNRRTTLVLATGTLVCVAAIDKPSLAQQTPRVIVQTAYWALPSKAEEVCQWRMHASDVREKLGLPRGRVLCRQGNSNVATSLGRLEPAPSVLPDVTWQIELPNDPERNRDLVTPPAPEFREVIAHMSTLIHRFEQSTWLLPE